MGEAKRSEATLEQQLLLLEENMEEMKEQMVKDGMPAIAIVYADRVLLPAFQTMLQAHHRKVPIADIDEAIVSTVASLLFDYIQRTHPKGAMREATDHFLLIGQDVSERVQAQINGNFVDAPQLIVPPTPTRH